MLVSVVIPVFNREKFIEKCLDSVLSQAFNGFYEIIVVDDASTDSTARLLKAYHDPRLNIIFNEQNGGASYARNRGIEQSRGEYILFIDSDCVAPQDWIEEIIKPFDLDPAIMIVSGKTIAPSTGTYWQKISEGQSYIARKDGYVGEAYTGNMAIRGHFMKDNLFDERLLFSEDFDLSLRCRRKGYKIYYTQKASMIHFYRRTLTATLSSCLHWGAYNTLIRLKWREFPYLNYGTYVLLIALICLLSSLGGEHAFRRGAAGFFTGVFLALVFYIWMRCVNGNFLRLLFSYPFGVILSLANCLGNLWGIVLFLLWKRKSFNYGISILMYHRVNDQLKANDWVIPTAKFREQMILLKKYCDVLTMADVLDKYKNKGLSQFSSRPLVLITLDDGYGDNYSNAFPILKELGLPATVFLVTGMIGTDKKMAGYEHLPAPDMLSWENIAEMRAHNITFCSHTDIHPYLSQLSIEEQRLHIQNGIETLYQRLGDNIIKEVFCYPYGEYNKSTLRILRELNIKAALTVDKGINDQQQDSLLLKRFIYHKACKLFNRFERKG